MYNLVQYLELVFFRKCVLPIKANIEFHYFVKCSLFFSFQTLFIKYIFTQLQQVKMERYIMVYLCMYCMCMEDGVKRILEILTLILKLSA